MRRGIVAILIFVVLLAAPILVRFFRFSSFGAPERAPVPTYDLGEIDLVPTPAANSFVDTPNAGEGLVLLDVAHENLFSMDEIGSLDGRLSARGFEMVEYRGGDLAAALRSVSAFVVITPITEFSLEERLITADFVARGGKLLLIGDPSRFAVEVQEDLFGLTFELNRDEIPLNSLANEFSIAFEGDYLYNTLENEGNFRNIIVNEAGIGESDVTDGLSQVALYGTHSVSGGEGVLLGDDNTWSSATDRPGGLTMATVGGNGRVLAIGDIHFLTEPYFTVFDNSQLIAQIADFLTGVEERDYVLADFPYYFGDEIELVYTGEPDLGPGAFDDIISLQEAFRAVGKELTLTAEASGDADALIVGLYNQTAVLTDVLETAEIALLIDPPLLTDAELALLEADDEDEADETAEELDETEADEAEEEEDEEETADSAIRIVQSSLGRVQMSGTSLLLLQEEGGNYTVLLLAASGEGLENSISRLIDVIPLDADFALADCLLNDGLALCPTGVADEEVEAELLTGGQEELPEMEEEEEDTGDEDDEAGGGLPDIEPNPNAIDQGSIALGEEVEATLGEGETFVWTFGDGPATLDITVVGDEEMDAVIELFDPDGNFVASADVTFSGGTEEILGVDVEEGDYLIQVRDFFDDGGGFTLSVTEGEGGDGASSNASIFLFVDDDGEATGEGLSSTDALTVLLEPNYNVTTWVSSIDGPLDATALEGTTLLIWDSGDYQTPAGFDDPDVNTIVEFLDEGESNILFTGSVPPFVGTEFEASTVSDVVFTGEDDILLEGFAAGDVLTLETAVSSVTPDFFEEDEFTTLFLLRGDASDNPELPVGLAVIDNFNGEQRSVFLFFPFTLLPEDAQGQLLENMLNWLG